MRIVMKLLEDTQSYNQDDNVKGKFMKIGGNQRDEISEIFGEEQQKAEWLRAGKRMMKLGDKLRNSIINYNDSQTYNQCETVKIL